LKLLVYSILDDFDFESSKNPKRLDKIPGLLSSYKFELFLCLSISILNGVNLFLREKYLFG